MSGLQGRVGIWGTRVNRKLSLDFRVLGRRKHSLRVDSTVRKCKFLAKQYKHPSQIAFTIGSPVVFCGLQKCLEINKWRKLYRLMKNKSSLHPRAARVVPLSLLFNIYSYFSIRLGLIKGKKSHKPFAAMQSFMSKYIYLKKSEGRRLLLLSLISLWKESSSIRC